MRAVRLATEGKPSARAFALLCRIPVRTYYHYERDETAIPAKALEMVISASGCSSVYLLTGRGPIFLGKDGRAAGVELIAELYDETDTLRQRLEEAEYEMRRARREREPVLRIVAREEAAAYTTNIEGEVEACVAVPILEGAIAAGCPTNVFEEQIEGWAICYRSAVRHPEETSCVRVRGDSMAPYIPDGSLVGIDHSLRQADALLQQFVALRVDDDCVIRRLTRANGHYIGLPANPTEVNLPVVFGPHGCSEGECTVVGKVIFSFATFE